jgi:LysR family cyn operon transcriptional activator
MELRQLRYFVTAAETLNFSEAAKMLYITQSTLSQQIRQLENEMGIKLFQRNSHSVLLTEAGEQLLPSALNAINAADTCAERIQDLKKLLTGTLNIGVTYSFSPIIAEPLVTFMKQYPSVKVNIFNRSVDELMVMLAKHQVDFVLAFKPAEVGEDVEFHTLFDSNLAVIVRNGHPLEKFDKLSMDDIKPYDFALPMRGLQARNKLSAIVGETISQLKVRAELNEVNILLHLIRETDMVTILTEATIYGQAGIKAIPLMVKDRDMAGCVHMLKNAYRKHSASAFLKLLSESNAVRQRISEWL